MKKIIFAVVILFGLNVNAEIIVDRIQIKKEDNEKKYNKYEEICFEAVKEGKMIQIPDSRFTSFVHDNRIISLVTVSKSGLKLKTICLVQNGF